MFARLPASVGVLVLATAVAAQSPQSPAAGRRSPEPPPPADLAEVMRAMLLPNSNVIFAAQRDDFLLTAADPDPSIATDPFRGVYSGWQAVENACIAIVETTRLLAVPDRRCSNGKRVPVSDRQFVRMVGDLRAAGLAASAAARSRSHEQMLDAAEKVSTACSTCHLMYREKGGEEHRCTPQPQAAQR
jgi:hypothetical protein